MVHKRKRLFIPAIKGLAFLCTLAVLTACGQGLPKEMKNKAKAIPGTVKAVKAQVETHENKYKTLTKSPEFKAVESFAAKENWEQKFQLALGELKRAKGLYDNELSPLVKKNKPELAPKVKQQITRIKKVIQGAEELARYPSSRFSKIKNTIQNADQLYSRSKGNTEDIQQIANDMETGPMAKAITDFPDLTEKINTRFAPLLKLEKDSREHLNVITTEYSRHSAGSNADYAAYTDSVDAIFSGLAQAQKFKTKLVKDTDQLYTSYTKILKDMKEEYFVTIKRESWNENSDFYDPKFATFHRQVSPELYELLISDDLDIIADISAGFTGSRFSNKIGNSWKTLSIDPTSEWPGRGHNAASFWVEDSKEAYFHKYILEKNGETQETDWEKVDASFYDANFEYLGMAILAKPYGMFEKDRLIQPAPPGMAYVGNSKYGEWKKDTSGNQFWSWYGRYAFFSSLFFSRHPIFIIIPGMAGIIIIDTNNRILARPQKGSRNMELRAPLLKNHLDFKVRILQKAVDSKPRQLQSEVPEPVFAAAAQKVKANKTILRRNEWI